MRSLVPQLWIDPLDCILLDDFLFQTLLLFSLIPPTPFQSSHLLAQMFSLSFPFLKHKAVYHSIQAHPQSNLYMPFKTRLLWHVPSNRSTDHSQNILCVPAFESLLMTFPLLKSSQLQNPTSSQCLTEILSPSGSFFLLSQSEKYFLVNSKGLLMMWHWLQAALNCGYLHVS